jgi:hypothetical protein
VVARAAGRGNGELVLDVDEDEKKVWETDGGDGCITMWTCH